MAPDVPGDVLAAGWAEGTERHGTRDASGAAFAAASQMTASPFVTRPPDAGRTHHPGQAFKWPMTSWRLMKNMLKNDRVRCFPRAVFLHWICHFLIPINNIIF